MHAVGTALAFARNTTTSDVSRPVPKIPRGTWTDVRFQLRNPIIRRLSHHDGRRVYRPRVARSFADALIDGGRRT